MQNGKCVYLANVFELKHCRCCEILSNVQMSMLSRKSHCNTRGSSYTVNLVTSLSHGGGPKLMNVEILWTGLKNLLLTGALSVFFCVSWGEVEVGVERKEEENLLLTELKMFCFSEIY